MANISPNGINLSLEGKTALVIGSGGYLMSAIAKRVSLAGAYTFCGDFNLDNANTTAEEILQSGGKAQSIKCDVSSKEALMELREEIERQGYQVDYLVNGAGINAPTPFFEITKSEWISILDIQLIGVAMACQVFGEGMVSRQYGSIINISSASANPPLSKAFVYSAAKAGVLNFTKNLAREWATQGVRVNAIRPGFFPTEWNLANYRLNRLKLHRRFN